MFNFRDDKNIENKNLVVFCESIPRVKNELQLIQRSENWTVKKIKELDIFSFFPLPVQETN